MSRSKLIRALLAAASLLGAVPLMGQAVAAATAAFPYGNYTSTIPADDNHASARTLQVVIREGAMQVFEDGQLIQSYLTSVSGRDWKVWRVGGACGEGTPIQGDYTWNLQGDVLTFALVSDDCPGRGAKMVKTRLVRVGATAAAPAPATAVPAPPSAPVSTSAGGFPFGHYALVPLDSAHAPPPGMSVEFTLTGLRVLNGGQLLETHQMSVAGDRWEIFEFGGDCTEPGEYRWHADGNTLWMEMISDPCGDRAASIRAVKFVRE